MYTNSYIYDIYELYHIDELFSRKTICIRFRIYTMNTSYYYIHELYSRNQKCMRFRIHTLYMSCVMYMGYSKTFTVCFVYIRYI